MTKGQDLPEGVGCLYFLGILLICGIGGLALGFGLLVAGAKLYQVIVGGTI
jgi:hypothetical protein